MELNSATWRKSTYSGGNGGGCVEVGSVSGVIAVRDTKDRQGPALALSTDAWREFAAVIKHEDVLAPVPTRRPPRLVKCEGVSSSGGYPRKSGLVQ